MITIQRQDKDKILITKNHEIYFGMTAEEADQAVCILLQWLYDIEYTRNAGESKDE